MDITKHDNGKGRIAYSIASASQPKIRAAWMTEFRDVTQQESDGSWTIAVAHEEVDHAVLCVQPYDDEENETRVINKGSHLITIRIEGIDSNYRVKHSGKNLIIVDKS